MSKQDFVSQGITSGQHNAIVKNLMLQMGINDPNEAVRRFNAGEYILTPRLSQWLVGANGIINIPELVSDGTTGPEWVTRLEAKGFWISELAKSMLLSEDFKPTNRTVYKPIGIKATAFDDSKRLTKNIRSYANRSKWQAPNAELACLLRESCSDEQLEAMGLWYLITMHETIDDADGNPSLLGAHRHSGGQWLYGDYGGPDDEWLDDGAFVFILSQLSLETKS